MKMTKKFDDLNEAFNVEGEVVSSEPEGRIEKICYTQNFFNKIYYFLLPYMVSN